MPVDHEARQKTDHKSLLQREIDEFVIDRRVRNLSKRTVAWYKNSLRVFSEFLTQQSVDATEKVTASTIRHFLLSLPDKGYSQGGVNNLFGAIKAYLHWFADEYEPKDWNPLAKVQTPKRPKEIQQPLSLTTFQRLLSVCSGKDFNSLRDRAMLLFLLDTGVRKQELTDLRIGDIDMVSGQVFVRRGKGDKSRFTFIGKQAKKALSAYLRLRKGTNDASPLWATVEGGALAYHSVRQVIRRRAKDADIKEPGMHEFRRAFAINYLRNGGDVVTLQRLLGHSDLTIINQYLALVDEDLKISHGKHSPVDNLSK